MSRRSPDSRSTLIYLLIGLLLVALVSALLGGGNLFRIARLMVVYGAAFLILLYILQAARRRR